MLTMRPAFLSMKWDATPLHVRKTDLVLTAKVPVPVLLGVGW